MNHLSGSTQQTAAASEELSATADEMAAQSQQLNEQIGFFRFSRPAAAAPALSRRPDRLATA